MHTRSSFLITLHFSKMDLCTLKCSKTPSTRFNQAPHHVVQSDC